MNLALVDRIVNAVLYEGYMLYPYRASAIKNRQRWNFGALYPEAFSAKSGGTDASVMQTECLVRGNEHATIDVKVKFLHLLAREVSERIADRRSKVEDGGSKIEDGGSKMEDGGLKMEDSERVDPRPSILNPQSSIFNSQSSILNPPSSILNPQSSSLNPESSPFRLVDSLEAEGRLFQTWQEAVEREASSNGLSFSGLGTRPHSIRTAFPPTLETELLRNNGEVAGLLVRKQASVEGAIEVSAERLAADLFKIKVLISNLTTMNVEHPESRDEALMRAMVSTHTIIGVRGGELISLLDPPAELRDAVSACTNIGTYPVLVGEEGERDLMLSSPIILYDYPRIAPESAGELFDSTEIDEILTLRILTMTEEEKREMRSVDDRARRILERTEAMPEEQLLKLHGAVRGLRPVRTRDEDDLR